MQKKIILAVLLFATMFTYAKNSNKQKALSSVANFFGIKKQKLVLEGRFVDTDPDHGQFCKVYVDYSQLGNESLTVVGEYSPVGNIGDGIYFNEDEATFGPVELKKDYLSLRQQLADSFSTGMETEVVLSRNNNTLKFSISKQTSFLFISQIVKKNCVIEDYKAIQGYKDVNSVPFLEPKIKNTATKYEMPEK